MIIAALTPLIAVLVLLVVLRLPASVAMPLSLAATAAISTLVWQVPIRHVTAAAMEGAVVAVSILWIVFGAILLLKTLTASGALGDHPRRLHARERRPSRPDRPDRLAVRLVPAASANCAA